MKMRRNLSYLSAAFLALVCTWPAVPAQVGGEAGQSFIRYDRHESERSDWLTGGRIERAEFEAGEPDVRLTLNVPSFRLTLWQNGREVKSYYVGVGKKEFPIYIGDRAASEVIWNPAWIPPASSWVVGRGVRPGQVIPPGSRGNPLGKVKITLGDAYLIHQAAATSDLGNLVSHGCVRMLRADLYDLAEKIVAARSLPVSRARIEGAKRTSRTLYVRLEEPVPVDVNYDTLVVEGGELHVYPDVYERGTNTAARLRAELEANRADHSRVDDATLAEILSRVGRRTVFVVPVQSIVRGTALADGRTVPLIPSARTTTRTATPPRRR